MTNNCQSSYVCFQNCANTWKSEKYIICIWWKYGSINIHQILVIWGCGDSYVQDPPDPRVLFHRRCHKLAKLSRILASLSGGLVAKTSSYQYQPFEDTLKNAQWRKIKPVCQGDWLKKLVSSSGVVFRFVCIDHWLITLQLQYPQ